MMQFGGEQVGFPLLWEDLPGQPYLPMNEEGHLEPEAEKAILEVISAYLAGAAERLLAAFDMRTGNTRC